MSNNKAWFPLSYAGLVGIAKTAPPCSFILVVALWHVSIERQVLCIVRRDFRDALKNISRAMKSTCFSLRAIDFHWSKFFFQTSLNKSSFVLILDFSSTVKPCQAIESKQ